jgi:hypothetical protein
MKKIALIILTTALALSAQNLDSLMNSGAQQVRHLKMMPLIPLTPPDRLFTTRDTVSTPTVPSPVLRPLNIIREDRYSAELDKRVRDLEINITKVTIILENMQKVNEKHTDKFDTVMHFLEALITAMAGIAVALIGVYFKKSGKGK